MISELSFSEGDCTGCPKSSALRWRARKGKPQRAAVVTAPRGVTTRTARPDLVSCESSKVRHGTWSSGPFDVGFSSDDSEALAIGGHCKLWEARGELRGVEAIVVLVARQ